MEAAKTISFRSFFHGCVLAVLAAILLIGCAQTPEEKAFEERLTRRLETERRLYPNGAPPRKEHVLTIYGYNYTDQMIGYFAVNHAGGGNLYVSTPTSGGGGSDVVFQ